MRLKGVKLMIFVSFKGNADGRFCELLWGITEGLYKPYWGCRWRLA